MYDRDADLDQRYTKKNSFKGFRGKQFLFALAIKGKAFSFDKVILSHINLLLFGKIIKSLKPSTQIILWAHGIEVWRPIANWKKKFLQEKVEIWAVSNYTKQQLIKRHHINEAKIKVLHNTLDPFLETPKGFKKPINLLDRYDINPDAFVLFTLTRLARTEHQKNYDLVIQSIKNLINKHPNIVYLIGGKADVDEQTRLQQLIKDHHLENQVKLIGFIAEEEVVDHFLLADCFILPSKKEGFGIVLIEATACGCQVIGGNVDGSTDALLNGQLGQMINPDNEEEIIEAINKAIDNKQNHQSEVQQQITLKHFGFEQYVKRVNCLIGSL